MGQGTKQGRSWAAIAVSAIAAAGLLALPTTAAAAQATCPNSFQVLHDDQIGKLKLPKGHYTLTLLRKNKLSCERAATLFAKFLEDYDGRLQGKWTLWPKRAWFYKDDPQADVDPKHYVGFSVKKGKPSGGGGGKHPAKGSKRCPSPFDVLNNDSIGKLKLKAGEYNITRLTKTSPGCKRSAKLFAEFLQDFSGDLPKGWRLNVRRAAFIQKGSGGDGFRVKPAG